MKTINIDDEHGLLSRRIVNLIIRRVIKKKLGINPSIDILHLDVETIDDQVYLRVDADIRVDSKDIFKLIKGEES